MKIQGSIHRDDNLNIQHSRFNIQFSSDLKPERGYMPLFFLNFLAEHAKYPILLLFYGV